MAQAQALKKKRKNTGIRRIFPDRSNVELFILALPAVLLLLVFNYLPMVGVTIAFKDFKPLLGIFGSKWCGLKNFEFFFTSADALRTIRNTLAYSTVFIVTAPIFGVALAVMFYYLKSKIGLKIYNTTIMLPKFMSMVLISYMVYAFLNPSYGMMNSILTMFGMEAVQWYGDPKYWPVILVYVHIWQTVGSNSIIYYSTLVSIDESLLEAARIDGANTRRQIVSIIIPHLKQVIIINTILAIGHIFSGDFGLFYQIPMDVGLLYPTTDIINTYTFRALQGGEMARGAAVGLFQSLAGFIMVVLVNGIVKKISPEDSMF